MFDLFQHFALFQYDFRSCNPPIANDFWTHYINTLRFIFVSYFIHISKIKYVPYHLLWHAPQQQSWLCCTTQIETNFSAVFWPRLKMKSDTWTISSKSVCWDLRSFCSNSALCSTLLSFVLFWLKTLLTLTGKLSDFFSFSKTTL